MIVHHTTKFRISGDEPEAESVLRGIMAGWESLGYECKLREGYPCGVSWLLECTQDIPWGEEGDSKIEQ